MKLTIQAGGATGAKSVAAALPEALGSAKAELLIEIGTKVSGKN
jgi:hypothetical protein